MDTGVAEASGRPQAAPQLAVPQDPSDEMFPGGNGGQVRRATTPPPPPQNRGADPGESPLLVCTLQRAQMGTLISPAEDAPHNGATLIVPDEHEAADEAAAAAVLGAALSEEEARRKRRRVKREEEQQGKARWELQRRLADISTDVELLTSEIAKVRSELHVPLPSIASLPEFERQTLESARRRRLAEILSSHCRKTLIAITQHKWSWPFNAPVDTNTYKDYLEKVATPMDFGSIKRRLEGGMYSHPDTFLGDVRLVFDNARAYNKPGSDVHVMSTTLQEKFEEKYRTACAGRVAEEAALAEAEAMAARQRHMGAAATVGSAEREAAEARAAALVKQLDALLASVADAKSAAAAACAPASRAEKEALVAALGKLPQAQFEAAIGLVLHHHPGLQPFDAVGFDIDALDALTLRQLQSFVATAEGAEEGASLAWPAVPVGSGVRAYAGKKKRKAAAAAAAAAMGPAAPAAMAIAGSRAVAMEATAEAGEEPSGEGPAGKVGTSGGCGGSGLIIDNNNVDSTPEVGGMGMAPAAASAANVKAVPLPAAAAAAAAPPAVVAGPVPVAAPAAPVPTPAAAPPVAEAAT